MSPTRIHPCNNVTQPQRILLILKPDGVFANHRRLKVASNARQHSRLLMGYTLLRAISASVAFAARR